MKKILLIEDNEDIRSNTAEILELSNYEVITAENGKLGLEQALKHKPDLIICDIMMPVLDGYGVLEAIHNNDEIKHTPFIFLTAKTERADFRKGMDLGADDYLTKPFSGAELLSSVEGRLKKIDLLKKDIGAGLEALKHLAEASDDAFSLQSIIESRSVNRYKRKQVIYSEGNHPGRLYYVVKGKVKVYKTNDDGKELVTDLYSPGDFLGHVALLEDGPYTDSAEALEETELVAIPKEDFEKLMNNREIAQKFIRLLAQNITEKENQLIGIAYNSLRKKVAEALVALQKKYNPKKEKGFEININRGSLASIAGTATESLIRTLSDFKNEKLIDVKGSSIIILNSDKLQHLAN